MPRRVRPGSPEASSSSSDSDDSSQSHVYESSRIFASTSFDAYISAHSRPSRTSTSSFKALVPPLPSDYVPPTRPKNALNEPPLSYDLLHSMWTRSLLSGFDICLYGYGSKRDVLIKFGQKLSSKGDVILLSAYAIKSVREVLRVLQNAVGVDEDEMVGSTDARTRALIARFQGNKRKARLFVIVDGLHVLAPAIRTLLFALVGSPNVRIVLGAEHVTAPLLVASNSSSDKIWIWHDATTRIPYDMELKGSSSTMVEDGTAGVETVGPLNQSAASHILASVTQKAKRLFLILLAHQVEDEAGIDYALLRKVAAETLFISAGAQLKSLLSEFIDHKLVLMKTELAEKEANEMAGGEVERVVVNLRPDVLKTIHTSLREDLGQ